MCFACLIKILVVGLQSKFNCFFSVFCGNFNLTLIDMIFTFQKINSTERVLLYALNKDDAFAEMLLRYGTEKGSQYSLISYVEVGKFSLTLN